MFLRFILCLCIALAAVPVPALAQNMKIAPAQPSEPALIDVSMTVSASEQTMEAARKKAIRDGERQAFFKALLQLSPSQARDIYRKMRSRNMNRYIHSFTVMREVKKAGAYEADVLYRFNRTMLEKLLIENRGIRNKDNEEVLEGKGLLIIPPYDAGDSLLLFERENIWRAILNNVALEIGQGQLVMPFGDPNDMSILEDDVVLSADEDALRSLARRYGTRYVVVAFARSRYDDRGQLIVEVILRKAGGKKEDERVFQYKAQNTLDTLDIMLVRAARDTALKLRGSLESYSLFGEAEEQKRKALVVRLEYSHGRDWRKMHELLEHIPAVESMKLGAVAVHYAQATVVYRGSDDIMEASLNAHGFDVEKRKDYWVLRLPKAPKP